VSAVLALAKRGVTMLVAKRALEAMLERSVGVVHVPTVESRVKLARELAAAGVAIRAADDAPVNVKALRFSLGLTQDQFAIRYGLDPATVANWEQGHRPPDRAARALLRAIARQPEETAEAQEVPVDG